MRRIMSGRGFVDNSWNGGQTPPGTQGCVKSLSQTKNVINCPLVICYFHDFCHRSHIFLWETFIVYSFDQADQRLADITISLSGNTFWVFKRWSIHYGRDAFGFRGAVSWYLQLFWRHFGLQIQHLGSRWTCQLFALRPRNIHLFAPLWSCWCTKIHTWLQHWRTRRLFLWWL
jgi:hypothetical protein